MSKRTATSNLTRDNWDDEEATEEMGVFKKASPSELKMRTMKRGKRRGDGESLGPSVFKDFTAFGSSNSSAPPQFSFLASDSNFKIGAAASNNDKQKDNSLVNSASPMFSFVQSSTDAKPKKSIFSPSTDSLDDKDKNGSSGFKFGSTNNFSVLSQRTESVNDKDKNGGGVSSGFKFGSADNSSAVVSNKEKSDSNKSFDFSKTGSVATGLFNFGKVASNTSLKSDIGKPSISNSTSEKPESFLNNIKLLNMNLLDWLKQHLDKNSFIDLTPVFDDYKKHLEKIKNSEDSSPDKNVTKNSDVSLDSITAVGVKTSTVPTFSFGITSNANLDKNKSPIKFTASSTIKPVETDKPALFQFGSGGNIQKEATVGFSFGTAASNFAASQVESSSNDNSDNEVPVYEVKEVKEDDAVYEQKVKLFYKKENNYVDKGVGTLFMKPVGDKTQLIVRALTNLGTILLNIVLNDSIPTQRVGKNNVMIVCVPNPVIDTNKPSTPVSMLIRVKTAEDADQLLEKINELKKGKNV